MTAPVVDRLPELALLQHSGTIVVAAHRRVRRSCTAGTPTGSCGERDLVAALSAPRASA